MTEAKDSANDSARASCQAISHGGQLALAATTVGLMWSSMQHVLRWRDAYRSPVSLPSVCAVCQREHRCVGRIQGIIPPDIIPLLTV